MTPKLDRLSHGVQIVLAIAIKDISEAVKSKVVLALVGTLCLIILMPRALVWAIDPPYTAVVIYDLGTSSLLAEMDESPKFSVQQANSMETFSLVLVNSIEPKLGLVLPPNLDLTKDDGEKTVIEGYVAWGDRSRAGELKTNFEASLKENLGKTVTIHVHGNLVYPPPGTGISTSLLTINAVVVILTMGIMLVPGLLFEEKQSKSIEALLVSPASIGQVVAGKALAGLFYILLAATMLFTLNWRAVVHWDITLLFTLGAASISIALGLFLGSFYQRQVDAIGVTTLIVGILIGAPLLRMLGIDLPSPIQAMIAWIPSAQLAEIFQYAFLENVSYNLVWKNLGIVVLFSAPFYALTAWKIGRTE